MNDHELSELLELADQDHPLPGDLEDDLLDAIIATYRQAPAGGPPVDAARSVDTVSGEVVPDDATSDGVVADATVLGQTAPHDRAAVVVDLGSGRSRPGPRRIAGRGWLVAGAAAALVVAVFIVAQREPPPTDVAIAPTSSAATAPPIGTVVADLTDAELCTALDDALDGAALVGTPVLATDLEVAQLEQVVATATELVERRRTDGTGTPDDTAAVEGLIVVTENLRLEVERGTEASADTAYRPARTTAGEVTDPLNRLCSPT